jgi:hypothetical protein
MKKKVLLFGIIGGILIIQPVGAQTWLSAKKITWNSGASLSPSIAVDSSNNIHVVWVDITPGNYEIYYKRSTDGGASWSGTKRLTWTSTWNEEPAMAVASSNDIHVVWADFKSGSYEIFHKKSTDGGATWASSRRLTWTSGRSVSPAIMVDSSNNIHVVCNDNTPSDDEIYFKKSTNGGASWTTKRLTWNSEDSMNPSITADPSNNIYVVWVNDTPAINYEIYYKKSTNGGVSWPGAKRLSWSPEDSILPDIASDSTGNTHVVWSDYTPGTVGIFHRKSTNGGITWSVTKNLTKYTFDSFDPAISVDSNDNIHVVWDDDTPGSIEIYYKRSTDGGVTWANSKRLTWNSGNSQFPAISLDSSNNIHVVWHDDSPGNAEIFYKKGIQ